MQIIWKENLNLRPGSGHGVDFYYSEKYGAENHLAFLKGFKWFHEKPDLKEIRIKSSIQYCSEKDLLKIKSIIENRLKSDTLKGGKISPNLYACFNA